jgi:hypothetical protein
LVAHLKFGGKMMEKKIEIKIRPKKESSIYEMIVEDGQKFANYSFDSKQELVNFLKGFEEAIKFLSLNVSVEIRGLENLRKQNEV